MLMTQRMSTAEYNQLVTKPATAKRGTRSKDKELLGRYLLTSRLPWLMEYKFHPIRKWRFDWALLNPNNSPPHPMVAVEFEGGVFTGGGHTRGNHYSDDAEKYSEAAILGWLVVRVTAKMVSDGRAFDLIERAVAARIHQ